MLVGPERLKERGHITVPAATRDALGIDGGDTVLVAAVEYDPGTDGVVEAYERLAVAVVGGVEADEGRE